MLPLFALAAATGDPAELTRLCSGCALVLWLPYGMPRAHLRALDSSRPLGTHASSLAGAAVALAAGITIALVETARSDGRAFTFDELIYVLQSRWLFLPGCGMPLDETLRPFFELGYTFEENGRLYGQYPPGWPAVLALFDRVGLFEWPSAVLGALSVWCTFSLGRKLHSDAVGLLAAALLASHQWFLETHAGWLSHSLTTLAGVGAARAMLVDGSSAKRSAGWALAGFLLGSAVATRPLTGAAIAISLLLWIGLRPSCRMIMLWAALALGALAPLAGFLGYNAVSTGHALHLGYTRVHGSLHGLGFGQRGFARGWLLEFTPWSALRYFAHRTLDFAALSAPPYLLVPVLALGRTLRAPLGWRGPVCFLVLPAVYFFYFYSVNRFYVELLPFLFIGLAAICVHVGRADRRRGVALAAVLLVGNVVAAPPWGVGEMWRPKKPVTEAIAALGQRSQSERLLLFIPPPEQEGIRLQILFALHEAGPDARIVVARDRGQENARLVAHLEGYTPLRARWVGIGQPIAIEPLESMAMRPTGRAGANERH